VDRPSRFPAAALFAALHKVATWTRHSGAGLLACSAGSRMGMLAIVAAIAFVINATGMVTGATFSVTGLLLLGLTLLALHQAGIGSVWVRRR
jgi:hypothetical protein